MLLLSINYNSNVPWAHHCSTLSFLWQAISETPGSAPEIVNQEEHSWIIFSLEETWKGSETHATW